MLPREIEAKFSLSAATREILRTIEQIGPFAVIDHRTIEQHDTYYDTADQRLARAQATLRVRRALHATLLTFKGPRTVADDSASTHIANRLEVEIEVPDTQVPPSGSTTPLPTVANWSPLQHAWRLTAAQPLCPVACIKNHRTVLMLVDGDASKLELALDDCVGRRLADGRIVRFLEAEVELKTGTPEALLVMTKALSHIAPDMRPSHETKLGRIMR